MKRAWLTCGCAALALAACSKTGTKAAADGGAAAAPVASAAPTSSSPPARKAGLWEQSMSMSLPSGEKHQIAQAIRTCVDAASEAKLKWWATENRPGKTMCSEESVTPKLGGGWAFHSVCNMGDSGKVASDGEATGDFGSHYRVDVTSVTTGSAMAQSNGTHKMAIEATWKGACPADMKPGDVEMPGGMKINLVDAANGAGATVNGIRPGQRPTPEQMAQMRAQAMEMARRMKAEAK
ncbi:MAG TPA: SIMPL domain-containing protein [Phenylobacterium sp.]|jgi:hypothetical protein